VILDHKVYQGNEVMQDFLDLMDHPVHQDPEVGNFSTILVPK